MKLAFTFAFLDFYSSLYIIRINKNISKVLHNIILLFFFRINVDIQV